MWKVCKGGDLKFVEKTFVANFKYYLYVLVSTQYPSKALHIRRMWGLPPGEGGVLGAKPLRCWGVRGVTPKVFIVYSNKK